MFHLIVIPAAKGAIVVGHAAAPHIVTAAEAVHVHATAAAAHPAVVNTVQAVQVHAVRAGHSLSAHAGRSVAKRLVLENARQGATSPVRFGAVLRGPTGHHTAAGATKAVGLLTRKRLAEMGSTVVVSEALKKLSRTPAGASAIERAMSSAPARRVVAKARSL